MGTKQISLRLLEIFLLPVIFCCSSCDPLGGNTYSFTGGIANVLPNKDSVRVGDTLFFNATIPTTLQPIGTNGQPSSNLIDFSGGSNIITDIHLTSLLGINIFPAGAINSFLFLPTTMGRLRINPYDSTASKTVDFIEQNGTFKISFGVVAKKRGVYCFTLIDIFKATKGKTTASISILMKTGDNHLRYLKDYYYGSNPIASIDSLHSYCFKVY